jgi:hypothetical protein
MFETTCRLGSGRRLLSRTIGLVGHYTEVHRVARFAGNLDKLIADCLADGAEVDPSLSRQFDAIVDQLTMPNGVTKTSYADRYEKALSKVLGRISLPRSEIEVLDLPASSGIACLNTLAILQKNYRVKSYVLGDLYHKVLYDPVRRCIFDQQGNLLQVGFKRFFVSLYRCGLSADRRKFATKFASFPHRLIAWFLRRRYRFEQKETYRELLVLHPTVQVLLRKGVCQLEVMDVFEVIPGRYDLILSFHLLQRLYFSQNAIDAGVRNLAVALSEGGLLIVGNAESFVVYQKCNGSLMLRLREGS